MYRSLMEKWPLMRQMIQRLLLVSTSAIARIAIAQLHLQSKIDIRNSVIVGLYERQKRGMLAQEQDVELKEKKNKKIELEKQLTKKEGDQKERREQEMRRRKIKYFV